jgi:type I restriction enzyme S subunit
MGKLKAKWISVPLREVLDYEQPNPYIIKTRIKEEQGLFPVLTANKSFIKGYTDETEGVYKNVPVIIFDDFTADYKFVDFPFKVKSSAMKFLKSKNKDVSLKYIFYQMSLVKVNTTTHKRYYISVYQNISFLFPANTDGTLNLQKQEDIVQEIETQFTRLDAVIKSLNTTLVKAGKLHKSILKSAFEGNTD